MSLPFTIQISPQKLKEILEGISKETTLTSILSQLDVALSTRASETTLSSINGKIPPLGDIIREPVAGDKRYKINIVGDETGLFKTTDFTEVRDITRWGGVTLSGRDITGDIAKLPDILAKLDALDNALGSIGTDLIQIGKGGNVVGGQSRNFLDYALAIYQANWREPIPDYKEGSNVWLTGIGGCTEAVDSRNIWYDPTDYTVTETTPTTKTWVGLDATLPMNVVELAIEVDGRVSAAGERMYVRVVDDFGNVLIEGSIDSTTISTISGRFTIRAGQFWIYMQKIKIQAYMAAAGQVGYITGVLLRHYRGKNIICGWTYGLGADTIRPLRVDTDGYLLIKSV